MKLLSNNFSYRSSGLRKRLGQLRHTSTTQRRAFRARLSLLCYGLLVPVHDVVI